VARKSPKKLVVEYDVTGLRKAEIDQLALEAAVQSEPSDGEGGDRYDGETGHPGVTVVGTRVVKRGKRSKLVVEYDVTGLNKNEIGYLAHEAEAQSDRSRAEEWSGRPDLSHPGHPGVPVTSKVVAIARRPR